MIRPDTLSRSRPGRRQSGFSLVELMLALALGLIVVTGIVQLFIGNSQTYNVLNGQARMQENARFALEFISRAARQAGYFGCANARESLVWTLTGGDPGNSALAPEFDVRRPVQGVDNVVDAGSLAAYPTIAANSMALIEPTVDGNGIDADAVIPGRDVVVFRSLETPGWRLVDELFPTGPNSNPRIPDTTDIQVNDIVMVSNCEQAAVFRVTGLGAGPGYTELQHLVAGGGIFSNARPTLTDIGRTFGEDSLVGRVESRFFFIAEGTGFSNMVDVNGDPTRPLALWQKVGPDAPVELVQGIEDLQVLYGIDNTDDGIANANEYVTATDLDLLPDPDETNVVSVRVSVSATSVDAVTEDTPPQPLRRTFTKTIVLRNANPEF